jgi:predicted acetyltransferase
VTGAVAVTAASAADKAVIAGLFQFYVYDFSAFEELYFEPNGRFAPYGYLDSYWAEADRTPLLVRVDGHLAGFVLLNRHSHNQAAIDHNIAEYFVARRFRRGGVGAEVLRQVVKGRAGRWEAAIMQRNEGAKAFWPAAIAALPGVRDITCTVTDGEDWRGPIYHFTVDGR